MLATLGAPMTTASDTVDASQPDASRQQPWREVWVGAEGFRQVWSLYSGVTVAPFGGILADGLRLRAVAGYSDYRYRGERPGGLGHFHGRALYGDLLVGYHANLGALTAKAFAGIVLSHHAITPFDPETVIQGRAIGAKGIVELWYNVTDRVWTSLDLTLASSHVSYSARWRGGWRFLPALLAGVELGAIGYTDHDFVEDHDVGRRSTRTGLFTRYDWAANELDVSVGWSKDKTAPGEPYVTIHWLTRF